MSSSRTWSALVGRGRQALVLLGLRRQRPTVAAMGAVIAVGVVVGASAGLAFMPRVRETLRVAGARWLATAKVAASRNSGEANEGEGSRTAARRYEQATKEFVQSGKVPEAAEGARRAVDGGEADGLRRAEDDGLRHNAS
jgi:hypothetical protein